MTISPEITAWALNLIPRLDRMHAKTKTGKLASDFADQVLDHIRPAVEEALQRQFDETKRLRAVVDLAKRLADQFAMDPEMSELQSALAALSGEKTDG